MIYCQRNIFFIKKLYVRVDNEGIKKSTVKKITDMVADNNDSKKVHQKLMKNGKKFTKNELYEYEEEEDDDDDDDEEDEEGGGYDEKDEKSPKKEEMTKASLSFAHLKKKNW